MPDWSTLPLDDEVAPNPLEQQAAGRAVGLPPTNPVAPEKVLPQVPGAALRAGAGAVRTLPVVGAGLAADALAGMAGLGAVPAAALGGAGMYAYDRATGQSNLQSIGDALLQMAGIPAGKVISGVAKGIIARREANALTKAIGGRLEDNLAPGGAEALAGGKALGVGVPPQVVTEGADRTAAVRNLTGLSDRQAQDLNTSIQARGTQDLQDRLYALTGGRGMPIDEAVALGGEALRRGQTLNKGAAQLGFNWVDQAMGAQGPTISTAALKQQAIDSMGRLSLKNPPAEFKRILDLPDRITYSDAHRLRSQLFDLANPPTLPNSVPQGVTEKEAASLADTMTGAIDDAVNQAGGPVRGVLDASRRLWSEEVKGRFAQRNFLDLMQKDPRNQLNFYQQLVTKPGEAEDVLNTMERYLPGSAEKVRGALLQDALNDTRPSGLPYGVGPYDPAKLLGVTDKFRDPAVVRALFPDTTESRQVLERAREVGQLMRLSRERLQEGAESPKAAGAAFSKYLHHKFKYDVAGAGGAAVLGGSVMGPAKGAIVAGTILGGEMLVRALRSPTLTAWLKQAITSPVGSQAAARATVGLLTNFLVSRQVPADQEPEVRRQLAQAQAAAGIPAGVTPRITSREREAVQLDPPELDALRATLATNKGQ